MAQRDRHGRVSHADTDRRRRPLGGFRTSSTRRFRQVVDDAAASLPAALAGPLRRAAVTIVDVPPGTDHLVLAAFRPSAGTRHAVLTVYRRAVESRAESGAQLDAIVRVAIGEAVADALGITDIDGLFDEDW